MADAAVSSTVTGECIKDVRRPTTSNRSGGAIIGCRRSSPGGRRDVRLAYPCLPVGGRL